MLESRPDTCIDCAALWEGVSSVFNNKLASSKMHKLESLQAYKLTN